MRRYTVTWGWEPPKQEQIGTNLRVFYNSEQKTREVQNPETDEITTEKYWLCDVIEFTKSELSKVFKVMPLSSKTSFKN